MKPLNIDAVLSEFDLDKQGFIIVNRSLGSVVTIPDNRYPGRRPVRVFLSRSDCEKVIERLKEAKPLASEFSLEAFPVPLIIAVRLIADADAFVIHGPNEVFDF